MGLVICDGGELWCALCLCFVSRSPAFGVLLGPWVCGIIIIIVVVDPVATSVSLLALPDWSYAWANLCTRTTVSVPHSGYGGVSAEL